MQNPWSGFCLRNIRTPQRACRVRSPGPHPQNSRTVGLADLRSCISKSSNFESYYHRRFFAGIGRCSELETANQKSKSHFLCHKITLKTPYPQAGLDLEVCSSVWKWNVTRASPDLTGATRRPIVLNFSGYHSVSEGNTCKTWVFSLEISVILFSSSMYYREGH